ncbi:hypothetical protein JOC77_001819 [Peribacillus deserti]|uniref:Uncharacterized protein n=1 Tax=Peribacillus deserti TaxID=673318 RepID=A0ABS2QI48_9BACI|nr:hypothetical protein [Peribacillus deserti]MBM7692389.1 hypothetical protein [Peribacillus deserti]
MNLELIWTLFIDTLANNHEIHSAFYKKSAGIPFLYVSAVSKDFDPYQAEFAIKEASAQVMKGKQLHSETVFVRQDEKLYVYRHRFYVPQRKMFCCGNLCADCIRFTQ